MKVDLRFCCSRLSRRLGGSLAILLCAIVCGCNSDAPDSENSEPNSSNSSTADEQPKVAEVQSKPSLVGVWLGLANLDRDKLQKHLDSIADPQERTRLEKVANSFMSTQMAAEFSANGDLKFDLEMRAVNGQLLEGSSWGSWKLIKQTDEYVIIEKTEQFDDGASESKIVRYDFVPSDFVSSDLVVGNESGSQARKALNSGQHPNRFELAFLEIAELNDFNPVILFERRDLGESSRVAEQNSDGGRK